MQNFRLLLLVGPHAYLRRNSSASSRVPRPGQVKYEQTHLCDLFFCGTIMPIPAEATTITIQRPFMPPVSNSVISRHVAVIGAGAAGLVTARELRRRGHSVVVFERCNQVGGTWVYTQMVESEHLGLDPNRNRVHSSLYCSLRTNLPRETMGFSDYPFSSRNDPDRDQRRFPGHREVLMYLEDFAREFGIGELVRFETEVLRVELMEGSKWNVKSRKRDEDEALGLAEIFDAVVVCNGHYTEPRISLIPGMNDWPGKQMHSHNYRVPEPFRDQVVVLIGSSASAVDISRDIAGVAKEVHIAARTVGNETFGKQPGYDDMWLHPMIERVSADGTIHFQDGSFVLADVILHCTGVVTVDDNRVGPLYKHVFPPALAPWLSFVGLPWKGNPFPTFELQSKWIAGVLSNQLKLPSQEEMMEDVETFYSSLEAAGTPKRYTHCLGISRFEYHNWLAAQCGCPGNDEWRELMYRANGRNKRVRPESYREEWEDHHLVLQAHEDFIKYTSNGVRDKCVSE